MRRIESLGILRPCWGKEGIATLALEVRDGNCIKNLSFPSLKPTPSRHHQLIIINTQKHQRSRQIQLFKQNSTKVNMPSFTQPKVPQTSTKNFNAYCVVM